MREKEFIVYTKTGCSHCIKMKHLLSLLELKFVEYVLDRDFSLDEFKEKFPEAKTFPQVTVDGDVIGNSEQVVNYLKECKLM